MLLNKKQISINQSGFLVSLFKVLLLTTLLSLSSSMKFEPALEEAKPNLPLHRFIRCHS